MLTTIVVPVDDSPTCERALPVAATLSRATGATVELVTIDPLGVDPGWTDHRLAGLAAGLGPDVAVTTTVVPTTGTVVEALAALDRGPGTLLCLAPRARTPLASIVLGSVAEGVVRRSPRPVLLVGPACTVPPEATARRPVVAALDGSDRDEATLATALDWARATGAPFVALHVVTRPSDPEAWASADAVLAAAETRAAAVGVHAATSLVAASDPEDGLLRAVAGDAGCVVVGSHRRRGPGRLVLGSTVSAVARRAVCPVLVAGRAEPDRAGRTDLVTAGAGRSVSVGGGLG